MFRAAHDVVGGVTPSFQQQIGLADGIGLGVDLLAVEVGGNVLAVVGGELLQGLLGHGQHPAGPAGTVVKEIGSRADLVGNG